MSFISHPQLLKAQKVLYMTHLAIGDFIYQGALLQALKNKYPNIKLDIWIDDCRNKQHSWHKSRNTVLCQWIQEVNFIDEIYPIVNSKLERNKLIEKAKKQDYDLIIFVGKNRSHKYAQIARKISSTAYVVCSHSNVNCFSRLIHYRNINNSFDFKSIIAQKNHITEVYQSCFSKLFGLKENEVGEQKEISIPIHSSYESDAKTFFESHFKTKKNESTTVFINHISTSKKRDYPWSALKAVILDIEKSYSNMCFIINTPPHLTANTQQNISHDQQLKALKIAVFSAKSNFFQLPAIMNLADVVLTVETSTTHLAVCLNKPQVVIMHNKLPLWQPRKNCTILTGNGNASSVPPTQVNNALKSVIDKKILLAQ